MSHLQTRPELLIRLKSEDDQAAWQEFVECYEPFLRQLASRQGVPQRDLCDVTQQILLAIARSIEGWQNDGAPASFRRWLRVVARNAAIRFMTRERRRPAAAGGTEVLELLREIPATSDQDDIRGYEQELIVWAADQVRGQFQENSWQAFHRTTMQQQSIAEVAEDLNMSTGAVYMSRSRIVARIRERVQWLLRDNATDDEPGHPDSSVSGSDHQKGT